MMDSGETAQAAPKGKRRTLRQKNRILDETLESDSTDEAKSFRSKRQSAWTCLFVHAFFLQKVNKTLKFKVFNKKWSVGFDASIQKKGEC